MPNKNKSSLLKELFSLVLLVTKLFNIFNYFVKHLVIAANLTTKNLMDLFVYLIVFAMLLVFTWIGILSLLYFYLISIHWNGMVVILILIIIKIFYLYCK